MDSILNTDLLSTMVKNARADRGLRAVADEIQGVSFTTLSRIEKGKVPDVETFVKICKWLDVKTDTFVTDADGADQSRSNKERIVASLRAERELSKETVNTLIKVIDMAYKSK